LAKLQRLRTALVARWQRHRRVALALAAVTLLGALLWAGRAPTLRLINPHGEPVLLLIDGKEWGWIPPSSTETPGAGRSLRLAPGLHKLTFRSASGAPLDELQPDLYPSGHYLVAPGESDQCFWIEHTAYGQAQPQAPPLRKLPPEQRIWALPDEVDAWFFPTPPPSSDRRSSGGTRTAVRQSRCGFEPWR
jgi:hypothetical protein